MGACCAKLKGGGSGPHNDSRNDPSSSAYDHGATSSEEEGGGNPRVKIIHTRNDFDEITKGANGKLIVADFHAPWCGPCQLVSPKVDIFADEFAEKVVFIKVRLIN
jgi:thiol-disulfide isomerase/thioredoxin